MEPAGPRSDSEEKEWTTVTTSRPVESDPRPRVTHGNNKRICLDKVRVAAA